MSAKTLFNINVFDGHGIRQNQWVKWDENILEIGSGDGYLQHSGELIDGKNGFITPKLIDTHIHGGNGTSNDDGLEAMNSVIEFHALHGVGKTMLSLISAPVNDMVGLIETAHKITDQRFLGLHLEGPFISEQYKGAHDPTVLHAPTIEELESIIQASKGIVRSMTIAPELISDQQLALLTSNDIVPCFGHSAADYELTKDFFAKGSNVMTHAFNGMSGIHHRKPGPVPAALEAGAFTELIADGVHIQPAAARLLDPEKVILVTDAMAATGMPDGDYMLGSMSVKVKDSVARTESGSIAGSTLLLKDAVRNFADWSGSALHAFRAAITNPAAAYNFPTPTLTVGETEWLVWNQDLELIELP